MRYLYVLAPDVRVDDVGILWALVLRIVHVVHLIVRLWLALAYLLTARESCQMISRRWGGGYQRVSTARGAQQAANAIPRYRLGMNEKQTERSDR